MTFRLAQAAIDDYQSAHGMLSKQTASWAISELRKMYNAMVRSSLLNCRLEEILIAVIPSHHFAYAKQLTILRERQFRHRFL